MRPVVAELDDNKHYQPMENVGIFVFEARKRPIVADEGVGDDGHGALEERHHALLDGDREARRN